MKNLINLKLNDYFFHYLVKMAHMKFSTIDLPNKCHTSEEFISLLNANIRKTTPKGFGFFEENAINPKLFNFRNTIKNPVVLKFPIKPFGDLSHDTSTKEVIVQPGEISPEFYMPLVSKKSNADLMIHPQTVVIPRLNNYFRPSDICYLQIDDDVVMCTDLSSDKQQMVEEINNTIEKHAQGKLTLVPFQGSFAFSNTTKDPVTLTISAKRIQLLLFGKVLSSPEIVIMPGVHSMVLNIQTKLEFSSYKLVFGKTETASKLIIPVTSQPTNRMVVSSKEFPPVKVNDHKTVEGELFGYHALSKTWQLVEKTEPWTEAYVFYEWNNIYSTLEVNF
nr:hypothetical protein [Abalone asfa-like virus]